MSVDDQGTKCRRNIAENFNQLSRVRERYRQRDRQTDRQTDGRSASSRSLKTVHPILSDRCPALSVCDVGVLWPNGWMDQDITCYVGGPRPWPHNDIASDGDTGRLPAKKGTAAPNSRPMSFVAK